MLIFSIIAIVVIRILNIYENPEDRHLSQIDQIEMQKIIERLKNTLENPNNYYSSSFIPNDENDFTLYRNERLGFSIKMPKEGVRIIEDTTKDNLYIMPNNRTEKELIKETGRPHLAKIQIRSMTENYTLEDSLEEYQNDLYGKNFNFKVDRIEQVTYSHANIDVSWKDAEIGSLFKVKFNKERNRVAIWGFGQDSYIIKIVTNTIYKQFDSDMAQSMNFFK